MKKLFTYIHFILLFSMGSMLFAQTQEEIEKIISHYDLTELDRLQKQFQSEAEYERERAHRIAAQLGIPLVIETDSVYQELQKILEDGTPIYYTTFNIDAAKSTRTNFLHNGGGLGLNLMGQNMTAHIWDGGLARITHREYDGAGGNNRFSIGDGTTLTHYHSAHVTGTIIASGVTNQAKGMAPHAKAIGYDWDFDIAEATAAAADNGMLISNHSYGYASFTPTGAYALPNWWAGAYISDSWAWDNVMFNAPYYLMVVAAGNDGDVPITDEPLEGEMGYDKLTGHATSKNNLVVANAQDANINSNGDLVSVYINSSSSQGPTDDLRIKPDITGNGTSLYSTMNDADNSYDYLTGTSMASPNVTGTLLLLQQHYNNLHGNFMRAATLKGLALHTTDFATNQNGPNAVFGWGLLNAKRAAETITNDYEENGSLIHELVLNNGQTYEFQVDSDGINELRASISWTDRPGTINTGTANQSTPVLVNDLDIKITQGSQTYYPWKLNSVTTNGRGVNNVDPFERIDIPGASGTYTVTITHKGNLYNVENQNYTLILTGIQSEVCATNIASVDSGETCGEGTVDIEVTGNASTEELRLYTQAMGGTPIDTITGNLGNFTTPQITETTIFYVAAYGDGCESTRIPVTAEFIEAPSPISIDKIDYPIGGDDCEFDYAELVVIGGTEEEVIYFEDFDGDELDWAFGSTIQQERIVPVWSNTNNAGGDAPEIGLRRVSNSNSTGDWYLVPYRNDDLLPIEIAGYTDLTLSFKHRFNRNNGNYSRTLYVEVLKNDNSLTRVWQIQNINANIPATTVNIDLSAFEGEDEIYLYFGYEGNSFGMNEWYFDDIEIKGTKQGEITWSPIDGLFTDSSLTTPYTGGPATTLYALPGGTETYTATIHSSTNDCTLSDTVEVINPSTQFIANTGNWNLAANWSPAVVPDINKCVRVPNGKVLTVNTNDAEAKNIRIDNGGSLLITSGNSLTVAEEVKNYSTAENFFLKEGANLLQINDVENTGNLTAEKQFTFSPERNQFNFVMSPVVEMLGDNIFDIYDGEYLAQYYQESSNHFIFFDASEYLDGRAQAISEPSGGNQNTIAEFKGRPFNGNLKISGLTNSHTGFHLAGNPYPSQLDLNKFHADNQNNIEPRFLFWDNRGNPQITQYGDGYNGDHYAQYNALVETGTSAAVGPSSGDNNYSPRIPTQNVAVGNGFMLRLLFNPVETAYEFKNTQRTNGSGENFLGKGNNFTTEKDRYWLTMETPIDLSVMNAVVYFEGGNDEYAMDDNKTTGGSDDFYSMVNTHKLAIQGKASFSNKDVVPLGYKAFTPGFYTISIYKSEGVFADGQKIYIKDNLLGTTHDLSIEDFTFKTAPGEFNDRFEIVYKKSHKASDNQAKLANVTIQRKDHNIQITSEEMKIVDVEVYDLNGSLVHSQKDINAYELKIPNTNFSKQLLIVVVKTEDGQVLNKKLINN